MGLNIHNDKLANELTIGELKKLISEIVKETMEEVIDNLNALSSEAYINSIREAREDYKAGRYSKLDDLL